MHLQQEHIEEYLVKIVTTLIEPLAYIGASDKRIYWLYLLTSLLIALFFISFKYKNKASVKRFIKASISKKYWLNESSLLDLKWITINQIIKILFIIPFLISQIALAMIFYRYFYNEFGQGDFWLLPQAIVLFLFSIVLFLVDDFSRFLLHYSYHKIPFLWRFHAIHHSAEILTPLTLYRVHSIEFMLNNLRAILVTAFISGIFLYCFKNHIGLVEILGVNLFNFMFNLLGANLRHSHIPIGFGVFEKVFISPHQHQIHHSAERHHWDKNFGSCLAIWDQLFNSWLPAKGQKVKRFGLYQKVPTHKLVKQLLGLPS